GSAPNRIFVVSYSNVPYFTGGGSVSGQIHLYETTNVIEMHVTSVTANASYNRTLGVENAAGNDGAAAPGRNNAQWVVSTPEAWRFVANSATVSWFPTSFLSDPNITNPVASNVSGTTIYTVTAVGNGCTTVSPAFELTVDPPPAANVSVVQDCANSQFSVALAVTSVGTGANVTFTYTVNGGAPINIGPYTVASTIPNIGPFGANDVVNVTLNHQSNAACAVHYGNLYSGCPQLIVCPNVLSQTYCYGNNETRSWLYTVDVPGEQVRLTFTGITDLIGPGDVLTFYDGQDGTAPIITGNSYSNLNLASLAITTTQEYLYITLTSDASGSCVDANPVASSWTYQVQCNPSCQSIEASAPVIQTDCDNDQFSLFLEVIYPGDAPSETTTLRYTVNGGPNIDVPNWFAFDTGVIGPFALGSTIHVRWLHETDASCDLDQGNITGSTGLCPNDEPCDARPLTMNLNYTCGVTSPGDMTGMTLTPGITSTCNSVVQDVWYSFVATAPTHRIQLGGTTSGLIHSIFTGPNCSTLTQLPGSGCTAGATFSQPNGLVIGQTYYVRVSRTASGTNAFTVCVSAPPAADIGQNALYFEGVASGGDDRVDCGTGAGLNITGTQLTLEAWIYPTAWRTNEFEGSIINKEVAGFNGYMFRCGNNGQLGFHFGSGTGWVDLTS
ncbi:MAG TPA: hypothetical protein VKG92_09335, partial [Flavobacteriales bacterium]|nr:hypothetical protein [Flavobacteriales bacterium]